MPAVAVAALATDADAFDPTGTVDAGSLPVAPAPGGVLWGGVAAGGVETAAAPGDAEGETEPAATSPSCVRAPDAGALCPPGVTTGGVPLFAPGPGFMPEATGAADGAGDEVVPGAGAARIVPAVPLAGDEASAAAGISPSGRRLAAGSPLAVWNVVEPSSAPAVAPAVAAAVDVGAGTVPLPTSAPSGDDPPELGATDAAMGTAPDVGVVSPFVAAVALGSSLTLEPAGVVWIGAAVEAGAAPAVEDGRGAATAGVPTSEPGLEAGPATAPDERGSCGLAV